LNENQSIFFKVRGKNIVAPLISGHGAYTFFSEKARGQILIFVEITRGSACWVLETIKLILPNFTPQDP